MAIDLAMPGGLVADGTGAAGYEAEVAVDGEKIAAIGGNLGPAGREIDARGMVVARGVIDARTPWACSSCSTRTAIRW